jgi:hypothetical protein
VCKDGAAPVENAGGTVKTLCADSGKAAAYCAACGEAVQAELC